MRVIVVGGGVIGLACARELVRRGVDAVVLERARCGAGCSLGNAGWVTPTTSAPLPAPGVARVAVRWMLDSQSPLFVRPRLDRSFLSWSWRFWRSSTPSRYRAGFRALLALNRRTFELFDELRDESGELEMHERGLVFCALTDRALEEEREVLGKARRLGYEGEVEVLDRDAVREREPAVSDAVVGALHAKAERYVRPETLTAGLAAWLRRARATVAEGEAAERLEPAGAGWVVVTGERELRADRVVVATGASVDLLARLGVRVPLEGAKGYSVTGGGEGTRPRHALYLLEARVGCSPFRDDVRFAGTLELGRIDLSLDPTRLAAIVRAASTYLRDWRFDADRFEWAGWRPFAPDGLPLVGAVPGFPGLFLATGHGMLGVTLAPATAAALAPLVLEDALVPELVPFRLERFGARRAARLSLRS